MRSPLHLADLYPLEQASTYSKGAPEAGARRTRALTETATAWRDRDGVIHGNPQCAKTTPEPIAGTVHEITQQALCNDPACINTETLTGSPCPSRSLPAYAQETLSQRIRELEALVNDQPYLALTEGRLLQDRINSPSYAPWQNPADRDRLSTALARAQAKLSSRGHAEAARETAANAYLAQIDLGPLEDLRRLIGNHPEPHLAALENLERALEKYTASQADQQYLSKLLYRLEEETHLDSTLKSSLHGQAHARTILGRKRGPHHDAGYAWHRAAQETAEQLPNWWERGREQLMRADDVAVTYLPESRVRRQTDYPWEVHRRNFHSRLLLLPYPAGRLAELAYGATVALTGETPAPGTLDTLEVLVADEERTPTRSELEVHLRTAQLLAREPATAAAR